MPSLTDFEPRTLTLSPPERAQSGPAGLKVGQGKSGKADESPDGVAGHHERDARAALRRDSAGLADPGRGLEDIALHGRIGVPGRLQPGVQLAGSPLRLGGLGDRPDDADSSSAGLDHRVDVLREMPPMANHGFELISGTGALRAA